MSLLSWERGLKSFDVVDCYKSFAVAPLVGAWIEMLRQRARPEGEHVAPLVGAWIEIY